MGVLAMHSKVHRIGTCKRATSLPSSADLIILDLGLVVKGDGAMPLALHSWLAAQLALLQGRGAPHGQR